MNDAAAHPNYLGQQAPRALIVAAVGYWGIVTEGALLAGACIILTLLGQYLIRWRWEFTDDRFTTMFHLCLLTLLGAGVAIWSANSDALQTFLILFQWLPLIFTPLFAAQIYSTSQTVSLKTFFQALRLKERDDLRAGRMHTPASRVALDFPFLVLVMAAASASNQKHWIFYGASMALLSWAVWQRRSHRRSLPGMVALTLVVCALGYAGQLGLFQLQRVVENLPWLGAGDEYTNLKMSQTSIGSLRETKLKGKVLFRMKADRRNPVPTLLLETTYNRWASLGRWTASQYLRDLTRDEVEKDYSDVFHLQELPPGELGRYPLRARKDYVATILGSSRSGRSVLLPLPPGARTLTGMPEMEVTTSFPARCRSCRIAPPTVCRLRITRWDRASRRPPARKKGRPLYSAVSPPWKNRATRCWPPGWKWTPSANWRRTWAWTSSPMRRRPSASAPISARTMSTP